MGAAGSERESVLVQLARRSFHSMRRRANDSGRVPFVATGEAYAISDPNNRSLCCFIFSERDARCESRS
jgi:hypothetical protein